MSFDKQKLLAYALGELDSKEAQQVEAFIKTNAEAARFVRENQQFSDRISAELSKEKIPAGKGLGALEQALLRKQAGKSSQSSSSTGWMEASVVVALVLAAGIYWREPLLGLWKERAQQTEASLDFYQTNFSSLSGSADSGIELTVVEVKNALAEWKERSKMEESMGDCHFSLPTPDRTEASLVKTLGDQKAWFYLLNKGRTQLRLLVNATDCQVSLDLHGNLPAESQAEVDEELRSLESELRNSVERKK